ncbi:hypothetical protein SLEP1_g21998 [Rubroshorea leprosula]|uniref:Protein DCL, chloroplastic n=1 Tax=Rubroshorea leprosula TaxID=152421 RepID=A0AAV5JIL7_9ROSI|nr:hypothetical protein SLEP1_g21998 [Rubroshorea leprosula]
MAMASIFKSPPYVHRNCSLISLSSSSVVSSFNFRGTTVRVRGRRTGSEGGRIRSQESFGAKLLRGASIVGRKDTGENLGEEEEDSEERNRDFNEMKEEEEEEEEEWIDWEEQILQETVPLIGFVRMILHSDKYVSGDRLIPEHEKIIVDRLLPYHPGAEKKIGCGIDYITVGYHPDFDGSRCLFIVRKDGELVDFSYWKCLKGMIRKNYPLYADSFILRHFRRRRR